jgi:hypothetical protein
MPLVAALAGVAFTVSAASLSRPALAHSFEPALLLLQERAPGVYALTWRRPALDAGTGSDAVVPRMPPHCRPFALPDAPAAEPSAPALIDCRPLGLRGKEIAVEGLDVVPLDVIVRITAIDGTVASGVLHSAQDRFAVPGAAESAPPWAVLQRYGALGVEHILFGIDHLLFVLGLMLLVRNLATLVKTVTAFTVAHSLTLALAVLGVVTVPSAPVEAAISLSIVLLAVEVARVETGYAPPVSIAHRAPWVVAFAFGLLHGLGFAGALADIGLPRDQLALSLLSFNLGVEAGQLVFVTALVGLAWAAGRVVGWWPRLRLVPAYAMGAVAVAWTLERIQQFWPKGV